MSEERAKRNEVFTPPRPAGVDPAIPVVSAMDAVRAEFGLDIPIELVPLPSRGKLYPVDSTLFDRETVEIRPMTAREEDILTSKALLKKGTIITELLRSCLVDKSIDPTHLLAGDRNALMVAIRITGYGHEYDAEITCGNDECEIKSGRTFDLSALEIKRLDIDPIQDGQNLFTFALPVSKKVVKFRFVTGFDEEDMSKTQEQMKKLGMASNNTVTMGLQHTVFSVGDVTDRNKISQFIRAMPARDSLALRTYIRNHEPGIIMKQDVTCDKCGHVEEVNIPLGVNFLWPNAV